jgi:CRP/FNR family cyclic AMP-dependent transcriptional regulator
MYNRPENAIMRPAEQECVSGQLAARLTGCRPLMLRNRQSVFNIGDEDRHIYLIISGRVKTTTISSSGRSCLVDIYTPNELLGMSCLAAPIRLETATAMTPAVVRKIPEETFLSVLSNTRFCVHYIRYLAGRQTESEQRITHLATVDSEHRLAISLLNLCAKMGVRVGHMTRVDCPITQQDLADMVGTTRSRVGYFLARFRAQGLVAPKAGGCLIVIEDAIRDYLGGLAPPTNGQ